MYQMGSQLGKHWAMRDATADQLRRVKALGVGRDWVAFHSEPAQEFTHIVAPEKSDFMGTGDIPSASFVAGFIDGAQTIEKSSPGRRPIVTPIKKPKPGRPSD